MRYTHPRVLTASVVAIAALALASPARAEGPTVSGAGSTWSQIAVDQWRADVARIGLRINYQGVGSSAGRQFFIIDQVDFAVSEIPFEPDELQKLKSANRSFQYLPIVAGGTSVMYNLRDSQGQPINNLRLSSDSLAGIFTGQIDRWDDARIKADNPGLRLPDMEVIPVIRSDGSGTSAQFSAYLKAMEPSQWAKFAQQSGIQNAPTSYWPNFPGSVAQRGSDGVANYVANDSIGVGAVTYVEAGYAIQRRRPVASVKNASGAYVQPTATAVATALTKARLNADLTQELGGVYLHPDASAYPISSYSYMITQTKGFDPVKGKVLGSFMIYMACDGQQQADVLGYSPLPPNLVEAVFAAVRRVPGAPEPPPLSQCNNPTVGAGGVYGEGPDITGAPSTSQGTSAGSTSEAGGNRSKAKDDSPADSVQVGLPGEAGFEVALLTEEEAREMQEAAILAAEGLVVPASARYLLLGFAALVVFLGPYLAEPVVRRLRRRLSVRRAVS